MLLNLNTRDRSGIQNLSSGFLLMKRISTRERIRAEVRVEEVEVRAREAEVEVRAREAEVEVEEIKHYLSDAADTSDSGSASGTRSTTNVVATLYVLCLILVWQC
ncbi:hypothetical protein L195_g029113 [Trifolium pratense]|uniref:Uncharacterized protein n=1 Tax=Trifolium pratense TaxID=57577 RepID=A0A2K3L3W4_TRIPR|nr:hypothetical protein L195_g029113 [Trifolium pratense]